MIKLQSVLVHSLSPLRNSQRPYDLPAPRQVLVGRSRRSPTIHTAASFSTYTDLRPHENRKDQLVWEAYSAPHDQGREIPLQRRVSLLPLVSMYFYTFPGLSTLGATH